MFSIEKIKSDIVGVVGKNSLVVQKHAPAILMGVGIVGVVAGTVLACKATIKAQMLMEDAREDLQDIHEAKEIYPPEKYSQEDYQKDLTVIYAQTGIKLARLYAPALIVGGLSIAALVGSHRILNSRNVALAAAYKVLDEGYNRYRQNVVDEFGTQKDNDLRYGIKREIVEETQTNEEGKKVKVKKEVSKIADRSPSIYARWFDEDCSQWRGEHSHNLFFLKAQQTYLNQLLQTRGHVFLNEVYDALGFPRTKEGTVVGWVYGEDSVDGYIDFGVFNENSEESREFVNGYGKAILLDFNVDGLIWELI